MDDHLDALSNIHRRRLLAALFDPNQQRDSINVPEDVHEGEKELETLQLELYHSHLPRLETLGFIRWNQDSHQVAKGPRFDEIRPLLELLRDSDNELPDDSLSPQSARSRSRVPADGPGIQQSEGD